MKLRNLIEALEEYADEHGDDTKVCIGLYQEYGGDFVYNISEIEYSGIRDVYSGYGGDKKENAVMLLQGYSVGCLTEAYEEDDDEEETEEDED